MGSWSSKAPTPEEYPEDDSDEIISDNLNLLDSGHNSDTVLICEGKELSAHKEILVAHSDVFQAIFDSLDEDKYVINVSDISFYTLKHMLHFLYSGDIPKMPSVHYTLKLLEASKLYVVGPLKRKCFKLIKQSLNEENICAVLNIADAKTDGELKDIVISHLVNNQEVLLGDRWQDYTNVNMDLANDIMMAVVRKTPN